MSGGATRRRVRRLLRIGLFGGGVLLLALVVAAGWIVLTLRASLPRLDGTLRLAGLVADVVIERDELGVPLVTGATRGDVARATGFLHAQDRFFQMDLMRRRAAGRLGELLGPAALPLDREFRVHRFEAAARLALAGLSPAERLLLDAYVAGVNAGLSDLGSAPPEYLALRVAPEPWSAEDSLLVVYGMYLELQGGDWERERRRGELEACLGRAAVDFLAPPGTVWDAPLDGSQVAEPPLPGPESLVLRAADGAAGGAVEPSPAGSNALAVGGRRTADGAAIVAGDMHLGHSLPNIWYRMALVFDDGGAPRRLVGVTLPGTYSLVAGSNGSVAWSFTNAYADLSDLVAIETVEGDPSRYWTAEGPRAFERFEETLRARGARSEALVVRWTSWGPVVGEDGAGRPLALRWIAHRPEAVDLGLARFESACDVGELATLAPTIGIPLQNLVAADRSGHILWTLAGPIPRRPRGPQPRPVAWSEDGAGWTGRLEPDEVPRVIDPPAGAIWSANHRHVGSGALTLLGDRGQDLGARARQLRDDLLALEGASEGDLLAIQLDDRALFLERWRDLMLQLLSPTAIAADPKRASLRDELVSGWTGRASVDSAAYRAVRGFRLLAAERLLGALMAGCAAEGGPPSPFSIGFQWESPLWRLVTERPPHLLDPAFPDWDSALVAAIDDLIERLEPPPGAPPGSATWGRRNTVRLRHPLSAAVPALSRWLDLPPVELPGDSNMPRVQAPGFGASERLVVAPGHEERGIFHMPGGQSGHFLSPYYAAGDAAWATGRATPLLPGPPRHRLELRPERPGE